MKGRALTADEVALAATMFGQAIAYDAVRVHNRKYWPFQPRRVTMAPDGHLWFHPAGGLFCDDFCAAPLHLQGHFIHEMTHVWQAQRGGRYFLPLMRHPFCRYGYDIVPGRPFVRYGLEQQAEIVRHAFLLRQGGAVPGKPPLAVYEALLPFG
ncbi:vgr related protein [Sphingobium sp. AN641]|uniref:vgr related protein n=1 Tax=Sphingobium sp. AN641 TaxID=3133443 RepID=UPI0030C1FEF8